MTRSTDDELASMLEDLADYIENTSDTTTMSKFTRVLIYTARDMAKNLKQEIENVEKPTEPSIEPLLRSDGELHESILKIGGKPYRCKCGCNVFHNPDKNNLDLFQCNACNSQFLTK